MAGVMNIQTLLKESNIKREDIADTLLISRQSLYRKSSGQDEFTVTEAITLCDILNISVNDVEWVKKKLKRKKKGA